MWASHRENTHYCKLTQLSEKREGTNTSYTSAGLVFIYQAFFVLFWQGKSLCMVENINCTSEKAFFLQCQASIKET